MSFNFNKLQDKHVLIIGGPSGLGRGIAEAVPCARGKVTIASSSQAKVGKTIADLNVTISNARITGFTIDLTAANIEDSLADLLTAAALTHGTLNHIVYTAAHRIPSAVLSAFSPELFAEKARLRAAVPFSLAKVVAAGRHLPRTRSSTIVLTGGNVAVQPMPNWALVNFIAAGLEGAVRGLAWILLLSV